MENESEERDAMDWLTDDELEEEKITVKVN